jgi:hypothetical protein
MDPQDLVLFTASLRQAIDNAPADGLDAALTELGWLDALAEDPDSAVQALFGNLGEVAGVSDALGRVLAAGLGLDPATSHVVLPPVGRTTAPGTLVETALQVEGLLLGTVGAGDTVHVATAGPVFALALTDLLAGSTDGIEQRGTVTSVTGSSTSAKVVGGTDGAWLPALRLGRLAVAEELIGGSRAMLSLARVQALDRVQFDRPISSFQVVRHRLAEAYLAIEAADALLGAAWLDGSPQTAAMAKAMAGRAGRTTSRHAQQVLAGVGFTTEHRFHLYARRTLLLDQLLGSTRMLTLELGQSIERTRRLPKLQPL